MTTSRDWYGTDWKTLRNQLVKLCISHSEPILERLQTATGDCHQIFEEYIKVVREDLSERTILDELGLWQNCLPLLIQTEQLENELNRDMKALSGSKENVTPKQAFARKLCQFFEYNRRDQIANDLGVSGNKVKTWERLDRISRNITKNDSPGNRCTEEHFDELAKFVKTNHGHDKNLPRKSKTVKGYFYRFSDDCIQFIDTSEHTMNKISIQETVNIFQQVGMVELSRCLKQLNENDLQLLDACFGLGISKIAYRSIEDFLHNTKMTLEQFNKDKERVIDTLKFCLELSLEAGGLEVT